MSEIIGASLSQFHNDENSFELLIAFSDGREVGHLVSRIAAQRIAADFAREFDTASPSDLLVGSEHQFRDFCDQLIAMFDFNKLEHSVCDEDMDLVEHIRAALLSSNQGNAQ
jgi:hypothetical protein